MRIRVLVVDDSAIVRHLIRGAIAAERDMEVVGVAVDGLDMLRQAEECRPDVITLDLDMPYMSGLSGLRYLMLRRPTRVVAISSLSRAGASASFQALALGAVDFVARADSAPLGVLGIREELVQKIRTAFTARLDPVRDPVGGAVPPDGTFQLEIRPSLLVVIGCSTGGPRALTTLMPDLPLMQSVAWVIVQHMPADFTRALADRLNRLTALNVHEAADGEQLTPGAVLVAPGDRHLLVEAGGRVRLDDGPHMHGMRPAADATLRSAAEVFGRMTVAAVLTGMGVDGAEGARYVREADGLVLAEDESSCVVYGMPRAVITRGLANQVVPISQMAAAIGGLAGGRLSEQSPPNLAESGGLTFAGASNV